MPTASATVLPAPPLPADARHAAHWGGVEGAALALALAETAARYKGLLLAVTPDTHTALRLEAELGFFAADAGLDTLVFPDWETLPYDVFSPHQDIVSQRLATLYRLPTQKRGILIVPAATLMQRLAPRGYLDRHALVLARGERLDLDAFRARLEAAGYACVSQVMEHGEFAVRGSIVDLYPMGSAAPIRVDLFDDEVESLRTFEPDTQKSVAKLDAVELLPAREFALDKETVTRFRSAFRATFEGDPQRCPVYREVSQGFAPGGIEYWLPLFFESTATLFDYLPAETLALCLPGLDAAMEGFIAQVLERYESRRYDRERPLLPPPRLFLDATEVQQRLGRLRRVTLATDAGGGVDFGGAPLPPLHLVARAERPAAALLDFLDAFPGRVLFVAESAGRRELLAELLRAQGIRPSPCEGWAGFVGGSARLALAIAPLDHGLRLREPALAVITEAELHQEWVRQTRRRRTAVRDAEAIIRDLADLAIGAPVVHEDHGVGRYQGLTRLTAGGVDAEFLVIEYAEREKLYVPVAGLARVSRYTGGEAAPLHRLSSDQWEKARRRAAERVNDAAAELLDIYARRAARPGHGFCGDEAEYLAFAAAFPFEETPDQQGAIEAVIADMRAGRPMDRVVCGDVGFGKTEVAMRAAFLAVQDGRQVAVLVPTTLLAQQHFQNFADRFADWPFRVESLSRFRSKKETDAVLAGLAAGSVDIVIGTHKLISAEVRFKQLGLVIIDEEHRFGVKQKEAFKALRAEVDILTLTATPIPRTLNMAMAGLRDLSIIATPPLNRLAVKTQVGEYDKALVQEACLRELKRGGQVYFLHNDVDTIDRQALELGALVPGARVAVAHGQMAERELERVMLDFYHQRCNLLVCTTIVESGIDVPSANTMIINRADKLGLAQLHQLRGRVGRSHHRAYCYLIVPHRKAMTADAIKRIEAIESLEDLGAGFMLASHDLEIRGAGELLGEEQSGQIHEVGFTLYMDMLERAVKAIKAGQVPQLDRPLDHGPEVDLTAPALIPDDYLPDVHARLILYKRIAGCADAGALRELQAEVIDRFGLLPAPATNLFRVTALKLAAAPLGVKKIEAGPKGGRIVFGPAPKIEVPALLALIQKQHLHYKLDGQEKLRILKELPDVDAREREIAGLLERLAG
ncbi:transcription-repair coupling factor [Plasticicumulans lactativorans]|uniref:Transcription-repair-coupling factor n=1 Tax=Plasticicumulans lactativorans TaxID=1133106 RepID=A0A4R2LA91_9GAMM|nr:transcription-repair coupling factor [Plasticicumulans lactativorans]TCO83748.1 transcription-repair coupling factor [Plasticicumulans lactativorans]